MTVTKEQLSYLKAVYEFAESTNRRGWSDALRAAIVALEYATREPGPDEIRVRAAVMVNEDSEVFTMGRGAGWTDDEIVVELRHYNDCVLLLGWINAIMPNLKPVEIAAQTEAAK